MGGNVVVKNKYFGYTVEAQKIKIAEIGRTVFVKKFHSIFLNLNKDFERKYRRKLWADDKLLTSGEVFNGSTSFVMNLDFVDSEVLPYKPSIGDIDILIKKEDAEDLFHLLDDYERKGEIGRDVVFCGSNRTNSQSLGNQINCLFQVKFGEITTFSQVDFELSEFANDKPEEFSRFGHSSALSDAKLNIKGVAHKYLLSCICGSMSADSDVLIMLKSGTYAKPKFKKRDGAHIERISHKKFSVDLGLRDGYEKVPDPDNPKEQWIYDGKKVFREIAVSASNYKRSIADIYAVLFNGSPQDEKHMWSFTGLITLMQKYCKTKQIESIGRRFINRCWGEGAQQLERGNPDLDKEIKTIAVQYLLKKFPNICTDDYINEKMVPFYENYREA